MLELGTLDEAAGDGRRDGQQVSDVVAEIGHQHGRALLHVDDLSHRVNAAADDVQFLAVRDDLVGRPVGHRNEFRVPEPSSQQIHAELQLAAQLVEPDLLLRRRQQHVSQQAVRRHRGRRVDVLHDLGADFIDDYREPGRPIAVIRLVFTPLRMLSVEYGLQFDRLAEIDPDLAEMIA